MRKFFCTVSLFIGIPVATVVAAFAFVSVSMWLDKHAEPTPLWVRFVGGAIVVMSLLVATISALVKFWKWCSGLCGKLSAMAKP